MVPETKTLNNRQLYIENLGKSFSGRLILDSISFKIPTNKVVALVGCNGAGKSTMMKILLGIESSNHGKIVFDEKDITRLSLQGRIRKGLGYMAQESSAITELSIEDNLYLVPKIFRIDDSFYENLLVEFNLENIRKQKVKTLSGGELRKLEFCLCMAASPQLVLLDEPFSGLEPKAVKLICETIRAQQAKGIGFIIADHRIEELRNIAEIYILLHNGNAFVFSNSEEFFHDGMVRQVFLG